MSADGRLALAGHSSSVTAPRATAGSSRQQAGPRATALTFPRGMALASARIALAVALLLVAASPALAQEPQDAPKTPNAPADTAAAQADTTAAPPADSAAADTTTGYQPEPEKKDRGAYHASPYLPLGHWAYPILDYWIAAGLINNLSPFTQPYRRIEIAAAIEEVAAVDSSKQTKAWLEMLYREFQPDMALLAEKEPVKPDVAVRLNLGVGWASQTHRDVLRPELDGLWSANRVLEDLRLGFNGQAGPVAYGFEAARKGIYTLDAQYPEGRVVPKRSMLLLNELKVRPEEGYLEFQSRYARVGFGRQYKNWAAPTMDGYVRSDYAYSQELLGYRIGTDRIFLIGSVSSYGDFGADTTHYVPMHRIEVRPIDQLMFAISEAAAHGGPGRQMDWQLVNPLSVWQITREDDENDNRAYNKVGQVDVWWRPKFGALFGSLLLDATNESGSCCQMGGSLGVELARLAPQLIVRSNFSFVQSLAYRTIRPWEEYSVENIGIGWDKVDLYLITAEADWFARAGLLIKPRLDVQLKGEGDFRQLRPDPVPPDYPGILSGQTETTIRPALRGYWLYGKKWQIDFQWDLGLSFIQDYNNSAGDNRTAFTGWLKASIITPRWLFRLK